MQFITGLVISTIVSGLLAALIAYKIVTGTQSTIAVNFGTSAGPIIAGAKIYAAANRSSILAQITAAGGAAAAFTVPTLVAANAVDPAATGTTPTGGTYCIEFRTYGTNPVRLQGLVTVVGETSPLTQALANLAAANTNQPFSGIVIGANAVGPGFSLPLSSFTGAAACQPGQFALAAVISDTDTEGTTNYLARVAIPGNPTANEMTVDLNMGGNNITNAATVTTTGNITDGGNITVAGTEAVTGASSAASYTTTGQVSAGSVTAPVWMHTSDERLKTPFGPVGDVWQTLDALKIGQYSYIGSDRQTVGISAQSIRAIRPELTAMDPANGHLTADYDALFSIGLVALRQDHDTILEIQVFYGAVLTFLSCLSLSLIRRVYSRRDRTRPADIGELGR
jgi:Bacterial shufflon protein, N-terminal constant region/Chaperone of endosialidase